MLWPNMAINGIASQLGIENSITQRPSLEFQYYQGINSVMYQRTVSDPQHQLVNFLAGVSNMTGMFTIENIDDLTDADYIPKFNRGRRAFLSKETQDKIRDMYNKSDFMLTTTEYLRDAFCRCYGVDKSNVICIPNYLPRWWIDDKINIPFNVERFRRNKKRLRIGIVSSLSHYNIDDIKQSAEGLAVYDIKDPHGQVVGYIDEKGRKISKEDGDKLPLVEDDLDMLIDLITKTVDKYCWVFFGYKPPKLAHFIGQGKIEYHPGVPITNYPSVLYRAQLNLIVAPCLDNEFNRCKSNIKYLEACALGVPLIASRISPTYTKYMPDQHLFSDADELEQILNKFADMSAGLYQKKIETQWKWLNSPHCDCGIPAPNWWLEDCLDPWVKLWRMRSKAMHISLKKHIEGRQQAELRRQLEASQKEKMFSEDGLEIMK